ncbi:MAG: RNA methyltransferase [Acidobacteria bacterium]|nr:RNA methyltransferase [Acidobacteriota bacterium]
MLGAHHPLIKSVRKAVQRGGRTAEGLAVAEGPHLLREAIDSGAHIHAVLSVEPLDMPHHQVDAATMSSLSSVESSRGVIALVDIPESPLDPMLAGNPLLVLLDGIQDPGNAGTILRSAEAFGATGVVFLKGSVNPCNPKVLRASAGSIFRIPFATMEWSEFPAERLNIYAAMPAGGVAPHRAKLDKPCAFVAGNEGNGVSSAILQEARAITIPTERVESLNAALATSILLYEAHRQRT